MKILYVTNHIKSAHFSGGFVSDYLNDLTFYGLRELYGDDVTDSTPIISLYKENKSRIHPSHIWGGMTAFWLIGENNIDRTNIEEKIKDKYYDLIIYGSIKRCQDYYELVSQIYPNDKVILIDGDDDNYVLDLYKKHLYFKRELTTSHPNIRPINFSFPTCKLAPPGEKNQEYATCIPGQPETYIFKDEKSYYKDYQKSYYGVTKKKAGWDCMRHYEILGNYCVPYFEDIEKCPEETLSNLPKELLVDAKNLAHNFDKQKYFSILDELFCFTKQNLTTKAQAQYILSHLN